MTAPPEVKSAVDLSARTLEEGVEHLSKRALIRLCRDLALGVQAVWKYAVGE